MIKQLQLQVVVYKTLVVSSNAEFVTVLESNLSRVLVCNSRCHRQVVDQAAKFNLLLFT